MALAGQIAIVTGASRGIGRGVALQLGEAGAVVYVTGRRPTESDASKDVSLPQLEQVAKDVTARGGKGIVYYCDHGNMDEVKALFDHVEKSHNGRLDVLVNNAYAAVQTISKNMNKKFFECPPEMWDDVNNVGLRNHYYCSVYGARLMHRNGYGLIVNISSPGGLKYLFNVPYGAGKQALDRLSADMAVELQRSNVCVVSLWPGAVRTELVTKYFLNGPPTDGGNSSVRETFSNGETIEYPGKAVVALAKDPRRMEKTGRTLITADIGSEYGFMDVDGREPPNLRSLSTILNQLGYKQTAAWIPDWIKLPGWVLWAHTSRL
ncbi:unnamed protein product [Auanema sp. JU1783]|nr:unnamed protein product [Auanema sp. JU1783]